MACGALILCFLQRNTLLKKFMYAVLVPTFTVKKENCDYFLIKGSLKQISLRKMDTKEARLNVALEFF